MDAGQLVVHATRAGRVWALSVSGDLDLVASDRFLRQAARVIGEEPERLVLDLSGVTFLDCAGVRALLIAVSAAPDGCPVVVRAVSDPARRTLGLLGVDLSRPPQGDATVETGQLVR